MKKLTKKQRREIYLKVISQINSRGICFCLCAELSEAIGKKTITDRLVKVFPEFGLFRPQTPEGRFGAWWDTFVSEVEYSEPRITCMLLCAEMCKP